MATATPPIIPGLSEARQKLAKAQTARLAPDLENLRLYVERESAGELSEAADLIEVDESCERLNFDRGRLPDLIATCKYVAAQKHLLDDFDERAAELSEQVKAAFRVKEAKESELRAARRDHSDAKYAESNFHDSCNEVRRATRVPDFVRHDRTRNGLLVPRADFG